MGSVKTWWAPIVGAMLAACGGPVADGDAGSGQADAGSGCASACDDGVFCNGAERCEGDRCLAGAPPCGGSMVCDEANAQCVDPMGCVDADGDGRAAIGCGGDDCDDADPTRFPGNLETCDPRGHDEDCDPSTLGGVDEDADGHESVACCNAQPDGALRCGDDCDDDRGSVHPDVTDDCNLTDDDCDGAVDEDPATIFYRDLDGDGFGRPGDPDDTSVPEGERAARACGGGPGFSPFDTDCDDAVRMINPAAPEVCADGIDNNCDAIQDADPARPGFECACTTLGEERACGGGTSNAPPAICRAGTQTCQVGGTWSACIGDVAPQTERCNDVDDDCDGAVDEAVQIRCYADPDNDGYAEAGSAARSLCAVVGREGVGGCPVLFTDVAPLDTSHSDCAASDASVRPGALDRCNLRDDDCDGAFDEGADEAGCTSPTAWGVCETGQCSLLACRYGRGDCDRVSNNGCETDLKTTAAHCGACGNVCPLGATCQQGLCVDGITQVSAGGYFSNGHTCALGANGDVWCWGDDQNGKLGRGTIDGDGSPAPIAASFDATQVSAGQNHTCAVSDGGEVWCWGYNAYGAAAPTTDLRVPVPTRVAGVSGAVQVEVGAAFSCARTSTGELWCWGSDGNGQLGNGPTVITERVPVRVTLTGNVIDFGLGASFGCAVLDTGAVWCWGHEVRGELGNGAAGPTPTPVQIAGFDAVTIEAGRFRACAIRSSGELWCWGQNEAGSPLGLPTYGDHDTPVHIPGVTGATQVSLGALGTCARQSDGTLLCWSGSALLPEGASPTPRIITSLGPVITDVCVGGAEGLYVLDGAGAVRHRTGTVARLYGPSEVRDRWIRSRHGDVDGWRIGGATQITGGNPLYAILASGEVATQTSSGAAPTLVAGITDAWQIAEGQGFRCVLHQSGGVSCWGGNNEGQLGVPGGTAINPIPVPGVTDAVEIVTGLAHACVRRATGRVVCWGANDRGQLGIGSSVRNAPPTELAGLERVTALSAGTAHTCASLSSGELRCWGSNDYLQLGNDVVSSSPTPVTVVNVTAPRGLGAGAAHQCVLDAGGRVLCWGSNLDGELGVSSPARSADPILVPGLYGVRQVDGEQRRTCALQGEQVICWGNDAPPAPVSW